MSVSIGGGRDVSVAGGAAGGGGLRGLRLAGAGSAPSLASTQQVLEFHSPTAALASAPLQGAARGTTWVVVTLVAACAAAASLIPVDRVVTAQGRVVARSPT